MTIFKAMGRESHPKRPVCVQDGQILARVVPSAVSVTCEKCNGSIYEGDWPWCAGKQSEHLRD